MINILEYLASELMEFVDGETRRLLVNLPPSHLKTLLFAVCLSGWTIRSSAVGEDHDCDVCGTTGGEVLRVVFAAFCSRIGSRKSSQTRIAKDHSAVMDFATTAGGALYAVSFGGSITGRGADLIIVDDPHDIKDAGNPQQLERTIERFNGSVCHGSTIAKPAR